MAPTKDLDPSSVKSSSGASPHDTVPNTPESHHQTTYLADHFDTGDFARLVPANKVACKAFHDIAESMKRDASWRPHARQYIHVSSTKKEFSEVISASDTDEVPEAAKYNLWTGYYRLSFRVPPSNPRLGWVIGSGRKDLGESEVDFILTGNRRTHRVSGRHGRFLLHPTSNALLIAAGENKKVVLDGKDELLGKERVLYAEVTGLSIGELGYKLLLSSTVSDVFRQQVAQYREAMNIESTPAPLVLTPTPASTDYLYRDYIIKRSFAEGATCIVHAGMHKNTGAAVAIKKMKRSRKTAENIKHEVSILRSIGSHPRICRLVEAHFPDGDEDAFDPATIEEIYLIYSPLASWSFFNLINLDLSDDDRAPFFWQCLEGIAYLHDRGIMHRDIKPANMAVVSLKPPRAVLIDFGCATTEPVSMNHGVGTIPYLAPEVMRLKKGRGGKPYDKSMDIWSFAVCAYQLFCKQKWWWGASIDESIYSAMRRHLSGNTYPVTRLVERLLQWRPSDRMTAAEALLDPLNRSVEPSAEPGDLPGGKRPREHDDLAPSKPVA